MTLKNFFKVFTFSMVALLFSNQVNAAFPVKANKTQTEIVSADAPTAEAASTNAADGQSQLVALLLCLLVGGLGIHRFYLGYIWQGIVQILTLGGLGIWTLIDLVRIITGSLGPKDGSYGSTL